MARPTSIRPRGRSPIRCIAGPSRAALAVALLAVVPLRARAAVDGERPARVTIQDQPRFEGIHSRAVSARSVELRATLLDDTGAPIAGVEVLASAAPPAAGLLLEGCTGGARARRRLPLRSSQDGSLCVRAAGATPRDRLTLTFAGDALHLPAAATVSLQPTPAPFNLAFEAPSIELDLDQPTLRLELRVSGAGEGVPALELELHEGDRVSALAAGEWSRAEDTLSFGLDTAQLGAAGPARLVARQVGGDARAEAVALRVARVRLEAEVLEAERGEAELRVRARANGDAPPSGWIEAIREADGEVIASAPLDGGSARARLAEPAVAGQVLVFFRSEEPWWRPAEPLRLSLGAAGPREARRWPWLALLVPIGYVCLRSLQRPAPKKRGGRRPPAPPRFAPGSEPPLPAEGWAGVVTDAHDGAPIAGARVQLRLPSWRESEARTVSVVADARGWFVLPTLQDPLPEGARLHISAPLHSEIERPLPPQGRVSVALTSRRRAVLRRLVRWARAVGAPWARGTEPTPGEIAEIAWRRGDRRTAQWAEGVQAAAFGDAPVDAAVEASLRASEPAWQQHAPRDADED